MTIRKLKAFGSLTTFCEARCDDGNGRRAANHRVTIAGHDVMLCGFCAREWKRIWNENLGREEVAA